jgi:hypothetical protein
MKRLRWHYAWIIVIVTLGTLLIAAGVRTAPTVFIKPLEAEFGWDRASISFAVAVSLFAYGFGGPLGGSLVDRSVDAKRATGVALLNQHSRMFCENLCRALDGAAAHDGQQRVWLDRLADDFAHAYLPGNDLVGLGVHQEHDRRYAARAQAGAHAHQEGLAVRFGIAKVADHQIDARRGLQDVDGFGRRGGRTHVIAILDKVLAHLRGGLRIIADDKDALLRHRRWRVDGLRFLQAVK